MMGIKGSDIKLLSYIKEKKNRMDYMQMQTSFDVEDYGGEQTELGYAFMEQIDTLKQIKGLESSICNDHK